MNILERLNRTKDKITFYYDYSRGPGQRPSTGRTTLTKITGMHYDTFRKRAKNPEEFSIKHLHKLAALIDVDPRILTNLIHDKLDLSEKKKIVTKPLK